MTETLSLKNKEMVVLLHGLNRTARSMKKMAVALETLGYQTVNINYPSRQYSIETLAKNVLSKVLNQYRAVTKIHFVTHSLGGILVRYYLANYTLPNLGRIVMLSPPNHGSEVADKLKHLWPYQWLNGLAGQQLGTIDNQLLNGLGTANYELGIISGNKSINLLLSLLITGENDGKVSVAHSQLEGMRDFLVLPVCHPLIMCNQTVIKQSCYFLKAGCFQK